MKLDRDLMDFDGLSFYTDDSPSKTVCFWCQRRIKRGAVALHERLLPVVEATLKYGQGALWIHARCWRHHLEHTRRRQIARRLGKE